MLVDFTVESLTEYNLIFGVAGRRGILFFACVEPELHSIKEVKPSEVEYSSSLRLLIRAKKHCGGKYALESGDDATVMGTVFGQAEEVEDLRGRPKPNGPGFLSHGKRRDPNGD